ncbi:hypothetical protein F2Q69_00022474 [Brassica cretica]|uniref:Uncharacterized protein n=1 Tax=Brassica cretica TaxID=69181 RepID=A0A8S9QL50_BRACR|nr:hypothetical protein F2Q69_00022474 [Brassica cretica]
MFFSETREKEEDIKRMFCEAREKMRMRITLKKKSDHGQFAIPCMVKDHLSLQVEPSHELFTFVDCSQRNSGGILRDLVMQIGNALVPVDFHVLDIKLNWNSSLLLGRAFLLTVGAVCKLQTNQLCLTLIDPNAHYDPIPVKKPQISSRRFNDPESLQLVTKSTDIPHEESVDSRPDDWENDYYNPTIDAYTRQHMHTEEYDKDYEDERATEYKAILDEEDTRLHHSSWKRNARSIDKPGSPSIDTQPPQRNRKPASTDITNYSSIDAQEQMNYMKVSHMRNFSTCKDSMKQINIDQKLLGEKHDTHIRSTERPSIDINPSTSIDINPSTSIDIRSKPKTTTANGAENLFVYQRNIPEYQQKDTKEFYDEVGGVDKSFKLSSRHPTRPSIDVNVPTLVDKTPEFCRKAFDSHGTRKFYWEENDQYGVYRDEHGYARDLDGNTIRLHNMDIRRVLERASRDEPSYICLHEHANLFTQTNEMFYGVCGEQEKNKEAFQMKLDGVYYPLNDSISWLTTCMEEMKQDIARIQHATDVARSSSIGRYQQTSIDIRQCTSIDNQIANIGRRQSTTPTYNEVSTKFSHQGRNRSVGKRDLKSSGNYRREA